MGAVRAAWVDMGAVLTALRSGAGHEDFHGFVPFNQRRSLPVEPGVYLAFTPEAPLYVGETDCLWYRWNKQRHRRAPYIAALPEAYIAFCLDSWADRFWRLDEERVLTALYAPVWQKEPRMAPSMAAKILDAFVGIENTHYKWLPHEEARRLYGRLFSRQG